MLLYYIFTDGDTIPNSGGHAYVVLKTILA